jgi:hypothetical protein
MDTSYHDMDVATSRSDQQGSEEWGMGGGPGVHTLEQKLHDSQLRRDIASPAPGRLLIPGRLIEAGRAGLGDGAEKGRVEPYVRRHDDLAGQRADLPTRTSPRGHGSGAISPHCGALGSESAIRVYQRGRSLVRHDARVLLLATGSCVRVPIGPGLLNLAGNAGPRRRASSWHGRCRRPRSA